VANSGNPRLQRNVVVLIRGGMIVLGIVCLGGLGLLSVLANLPLQLAPDLLQPGSLWKVFISLYASSWYFGTLFDKKYQIDVVTPATESKLPIASIAVAVAIFALFAAMWWLDVLVESFGHRLGSSRAWPTGDGFDLLILLLLVFWNFNIFAWRFYLARHINQMIAATRLEMGSARDAFREEQLAQVEHFIAGKWQWVRFIAGDVVLFAICIMAATGLRSVFAGLLSPLTGKFQIEQAQLVRVLPHLLVVVWFVCSEAVIWFMRIRMKFYFDCLQDLRRKYTITPVGQDSGQQA
jgi:hypothetical protein